MSFDQLGLSDTVLKAVGDAGYSQPTPIQEQAIPQVLAGVDVLGCAQTGTGKTASFTLPMLDRLAKGRAKARMPRSLILEPTRELAAQVAENFETYGKYHKLSMALLIGGVSFDDQLKITDRGVDVLIATPGRLIDLFERGAILLQGVKVLVIDDDETALDISERILSKRGFSVITADNGEAGIVFAKSTGPDIIVLDVMMPEMDGWQVMEQLRSDPDTMNIPIIMQSMLGERELGLERGADDYLTKPVDQSDLTDAIQKLLPEPSTQNGVLVVEEGKTIIELLEGAQGGQSYELLQTDNLAKADNWIREREFSIIIVGQHSDMDGVSMFMETVDDVTGTPPTPMLLLNSIQMETLDSEQLLSYINIRKKPGDAAV